MDRAYATSGDVSYAYAILDRDIMRDQAPAILAISSGARLTSTKTGCFGYSGSQGVLLTQIRTK